VRPMRAARQAHSIVHACLRTRTPAHCTRLRHGRPYPSQYLAIQDRQRSHGKH
jgi:hypothetical protein